MSHGSLLDHQRLMFCLMHLYRYSYLDVEAMYPWEVAMLVDSIVEREREQREAESRARH